MTEQSEKSEKGLIKIILSSIALLGLALIAIPLFLTPPAFLEIYIQDRIFDTNLDQMVATIYELAGEIKFKKKVTRLGDNFVIPMKRINSGKSSWRIKIKNFQETEFSLDIEPMKRESIHVPLEPTFGKLRISASDVLKPTVLIRKNLDIRIDGKIKLGITSEGSTIIDVEPGLHTTKVKADGYYPESLKFKTKIGQIKDLTVQLAPELTSEEKARIVLKWDENPNDLDSHLFLPNNPMLRNRHIYFSNKTILINNNILAILDVDDTTSYGPETVTIYNQIEGIFKFAVFHYAGTGSISDTSNATIKVITHNEIQEFKAPGNCDSKWWYVMDLDVSKSQTKIIPRNYCPAQITWEEGRKK